MSNTQGQSSLKNFDSVHYEGKNHIETNNIYTHRYLTRYYPKIMHESMMKLEKNYLGTVTKPLKPFIINSSTPLKQIKQGSDIDKIIKYLMKRLNSDPPVIKEPKQYYQGKNNVIMIPLHKIMNFPMSEYYQKDLNPEVSYQNFIIMKLGSNGKIISMGIKDLPKLSNYQGFSAVGHGIARAFRDNDIGLNEKPVAVVMAKKRLANNRHQSLGRCFLTEKDKNTKETEEQESCQILGGQWDHPCKKDTDCPFFRANKNYPNNFGGCNVNTGFCQMPKGIKNLTYHRYLHNDLNTAICYSCKNNHNQAGSCCKQQKNPDYQFKGDTKQRKKYMKLLESKGLNWHKY